MRGYVFFRFLRFKYKATPHDFSGELKVSSSRSRVPILFTVGRGHVGVVSKTLPGIKLAEGPHILMKKSAGQDKSSGGLIFILMTLRRLDRRTCSLRGFHLGYSTEE